jgi:hypothetical protein
MPLTDKQRETICEVCKLWYGTPYRGWTCLKGIGCDCGQLLKGVLLEAGHTKVADIEIPRTYSLRAAQHRRTTEYVDLVEKCMREIPEEEVKPGDFVIYKIGLGFAHGAIVLDWPHHVVHALDHYGVHAGHGLNFMFGRLPRKFYTLRDEFIEEEK